MLCPMYNPVINTSSNIEALRHVKTKTIFRGFFLSYLDEYTKNLIQNFLNYFLEALKIAGDHTNLRYGLVISINLRFPGLKF